MSETTAEVTRTLPAPPDEVWRAMTDPRTMGAAFFGAKVESDFKTGNPIRFKGEVKGKPYEDKGEILEASPPRVLRFSHYSGLSGAPDTPENYHVVTFALRPAGEATEVTLTQSNLKGGPKPSDREHRAQYEKTWAGVLDGLANALAH